ncbi:ABC transporter permease [Marinifilum sp.]|uniref:ABC transporter permease n=1 Tax=Marinifilum sp. TaxID=2033137 RepID=UPI003BA9CCE8
MIHLKSSLKFILRKSNYLFINIFGLSIGLCAFLLLCMYLYHDYNYNRFNDKLSTIYKIKEEGSTQTKGLLLPRILEDIPEISNGTRIFNWDSYRISYQEKAFSENVHCVDTGYFSIFSFPFVQGSPTIGIKKKYDVVISSKFAYKYFGKESAIGKKLRINFDNTFLTVTGVVDIPTNSSEKFNISTSYETGYEISPNMKVVHDWYNTFSATYVVLPNHSDQTMVEEKLQQIATKYFFPAGKEKKGIQLIPFKEYHFEYETKKTLLIILAVIALSILIIALLNFINLNLTSSFERINEIEIKKALGAHNHHILIQVFGESLLISSIGVSLACIGVYLSLPFFNESFNVALEFRSLSNKIFVTTLLLIWLTIAIISSIAPYVLLRKISYHKNSKSIKTKSKQSSFYKYTLLVLQFTIAIVLISGSLLMKKQINGMINIDPGFDKENVLVAAIDNWQFKDKEDASNRYQQLYDELEKDALVKSVCFSNNIPGSYSENYNSFFPEEIINTDNIHFRKAYVGKKYFETYGMKILNGQGFNKDHLYYKDKIIVNKKAMDILGYKNANEQILHSSSKTGKAFQIIGTVDNYSYQSKQRENQAMAHFFRENENASSWNYLSVRAVKGASIQVIELMKEKWKKLIPEITPNILFAKDKLNAHYKELKRLNKIISGFTLLAFLLSCFGLIAIASYSINQRTKEVGVRKVNGAKTLQIIVMLNKDFLKWVAVAFVVACPIAYYAMNKWLQNFAYKTELSWWIFALSGIIAIGIALLTVSWQSWRAARRNPVESLRYE